MRNNGTLHRGEFRGKEDLLLNYFTTDGGNGPTDAASAASDATIFREGARMIGMDLYTAIDTYKSYR